jgi:predicted ATPase/class 3 adenylate cyclase/Tfp pilus assembly protein PilF
MSEPLPNTASLLTGDVAILFTDIEGSSVLWEQDGARMSRALAAHDALARNAVEGHHGTVVKMIGDGMHAVFDDVLDALAATVDLQQALTDPAATNGVPLRVRCGLHAGFVERRDNDYFGSPVNRAARIMSAAHGGQVLISQVVVDCVRERLPTEIALRDLGRVRLKDLSTPEHVYQVVHPNLRGEFPALRSLEATPNNLPQEATSFIGREKELVELKLLLTRNRILTLTGSGGCGKTRLCLHVAADSLERFPDGAWLVELAPLSDPGLVPQAVAMVLGLKEAPGKSISETLTEHLKNKRLLLLLDNCEHLLDGCATLSDALVRQCPYMTILASSREALGIGGEQAYRVPSLSLPDPRRAQTPDSVAAFEAVELFTDRAVLARPDFQVTHHNASTLASICYRLDGIPLAIELAAARVRSLPLEVINNKLDERFRLLTGGSRTALPRQQTLRSLIDWSYDLLHEPEKRLLQRLSVFAGGWTLAAAERICTGEGVEEPDALDLLTSLVDKSLVMAEENNGDYRYRLLETVRQYAREELLKSGRGDAVRERHRDYFLELAEAAEAQIRGAQQAEWLRRLEQEHENLRAGLDWGLGEAEPGGSLRLCGALQRFWITRGHFAEGREACARVLRMAGTEKLPQERAKVLNGAGTLAYHQSDVPAAAALLEECLTIERQLGNQRRVATLLGNLGLVAYEQGDFVSTRARHEESLAIMRELGNQSGIAAALNNLAGVAHHEGDFTSARSLLEQALSIKRELGDRERIANSLGNLANVALDQGDFSSARALYAECLEIMRELGNRVYIATTLDALGRVACFQRDYPTARRLSEESLAIMRELQHGNGVADSLYSLANVAHEQGDYSTARQMFEEGIAIRRERGDQRGMVASLSGLAAMAATLGSSLRAARIWGAAERLREELGAPLPPSERLRHDRQVAAARGAIGDDAGFGLAWQEGRALTLEQAIELATEKSVERP